MLEFRLLRADEIDCRISICNQYGVGLLLYKNARCDMNILDEKVGQLNWQRDHKELKGNIYCGVSIWDEKKGQWITKWDCGKESYTESEKGESSDSFKRACFNIGIGRELYTAPDMFVFGKDLKKHEKNDRGVWTCKDSFKVVDIEYLEKKIVYVKVLNLKSGNYIEFGTPANVMREQKKIEVSTVSSVKTKSLKQRCVADDVPEQRILKLYKVESFDDLTEKQYANINAHWDKIKEQQ